VVAVARTDGWQAYRVLNSESSFHVPTVTGSGKNAARLFPWVHTLITNVKGNIRGVYHGFSDKHLTRYLAEFCYRFNRRFWEPKCLTGWSLLVLMLKPLLFRS
jgi:hypothetical protein